MINKSRLSGSVLAAFAAVLMLAVPVAGNAQVTTTTIRGDVTTPDGSPAAGAAVTITNTRTGAARTVTTNDNGTFDVRSLPVGGPYTILVQASDYEKALVTDVYTSLSAPASFAIALQAEDESIEEIVVTAAMVATAPMAIGPGTSFSQAEIQAMPSIARQIRDVIRIDPRVSIARADGGAGSGINCLGGSSRSNAFTIDGTLANDGFGLNEGTGTSARFAFPVPYDIVASASVEFAPLDVQYSQFTGCAINVVTKAGSNEFHGSAVYMYNDESLTGTKLEGDTVLTDPFESTNWSIDLSGPIIKDQLFFTLAYEETDDTNVQNSGPINGGFANEDWLTVTDANRIGDILRNQYGRDPGAIVRSLPRTSERVFLRLDWLINEQHRAEMTYVKLEELNLDPDDMGFDGFTFKDNFENEGIDQDSISLRVFSNWTDTFSTEFRYSRLDVTDIQGPFGGGEAQDANPIPRISVEDGSGGTILTSGPGTFRSANDLQYTVDQLKLSADWVLGDHTLTVGYENETRDIFNLFIPNATGTLVFASEADLVAGLASEMDMNGSYTQVAADAAAEFKRSIHSFYVQDEWRATDSLNLIFGLRYDRYKSSDLPILNPVFETRYGFDNTQTFDGLELVQPRIGLTWDLPESGLGSTQLSAGFGVFGGGDPTVHFANAYQNFGGAIGGANEGDCAPADLQVTSGPGGQFTGLPSCLPTAAAASANANTGSVAAVDPNFDLPANHRYNLGLSHLMASDMSFLDGWEMRLDYIHTKHKNAVDWVDLRLSPNGVTLPDGNGQMFEVDPTQIGCNATFNGIRQGFSNAGTNGGPCDDTRNSNQDILMTNGVEGTTDSISFQLSKEFFYGDNSSIDFGIGYAWLDATVGNPVNSSTAGSSYEEVATQQLNNIKLGPALWANEHNIVLRARLKHYWGGTDHATSVAVFFNRRSGRPYSYTWEDDTVEDYYGDSDDEERVLLYVPTGPSDPAFDFSGLGAQDQADLFAFLDSSGLSQYAGGFAPKNGFNSPWSSDMDIRIQQDIPLAGDHMLQLFFNIENFLNLLSDSGNVKEYADTGDIQEGVRVLQVDQGALANTNQFVIDRWYDEGTDRDFDDSIWRLQFGLRYRF